MRPSTVYVLICSNKSQSAESDIVVPPPENSAEAHLLLETARADREVHLTRRNLALQIVHRNTLALQYNRLLLDRAQEGLRTADRFIGHVRFVIRKSGLPVTVEYTMQGDSSMHGTLRYPGFICLAWYFKLTCTSLTIRQSNTRQSSRLGFRECT